MHGFGDFLNKQWWNVLKSSFDLKGAYTYLSLIFQIKSSIGHWQLCAINHISNAIMVIMVRIENKHVFANWSLSDAMR